MHRFPSCKIFTWIRICFVMFSLFLSRFVQFWKKAHFPPVLFSSLCRINSWLNKIFSPRKILSMGAKARKGAEFPRWFTQRRKVCEIGAPDHWVTIFITTFEAMCWLLFPTRLLVNTKFHDFSTDIIKIWFRRKVTKNSLNENIALKQSGYPD